jgi:hypothetical protein
VRACARGATCHPRWARKENRRRRGSWRVSDVTAGEGPGNGSHKERPRLPRAALVSNPEGFIWRAVKWCEWWRAAARPGKPCGMDRPSVGHSRLAIGGGDHYAVREITGLPLEFTNRRGEYHARGNHVLAAGGSAVPGTARHPFRFGQHRVLPTRAVWPASPLRSTDHPTSSSRCEIQK